MSDRNVSEGSVYEARRGEEEYLKLAVVHRESLRKSPPWDARGPDVVDRDGFISPTPQTVKVKRNVTVAILITSLPKPIRRLRQQPKENLKCNGRKKKATCSTLPAQRPSGLVWQVEPKRRAVRSGSRDLC
ncbi:hypothetical protein EK21DRAFT_85132 [Setomelanomma holmii]|uniref:Uncharacterized protein n=1 Tax=Setomelanomma holmii TaxID=210430 RepID=A0A9P4HH20_9PLEO|nr:hypothetical protein EK21DRAFT_85132 [Setomelanomma holmii]